jgi:endoglucanase
MLSRRCQAITVRIACAVALFLCALVVHAQGAGYWNASGAQILDANGKPVRIAGINWYGFETTDLVAHGLNVQDYKTILQTIKNNGYNTIRIPFSNQMVESPIVPGYIQYTNSSGPINADLQGLNSLQILDAIIAQAGQIGLRVILDNHRSEAGNSSEASGLWYTDAYPESAWINDWTALATRYKGNTTVIGMDVRNEPHNANSGGACWSCGTAANDWHLAAARAGNAILAVNSSLLIFVEGTDAIGNDYYFWGGQLAGVASAPVTLNVANQLVYSAHDYGPKEYPQPWFNGATYTSLVSVWRSHWGYIAEQGIAPVWVGEFGTPNADSDAQDTTSGSQGQWFSGLVQYLTATPVISWTYWALNGEDAYSLLDNNYDATPVNALKQQELASIQFPLTGSNPITAPTLTLAGTPSSVTAAASPSDTGNSTITTEVTYSAVLSNGTASAISSAAVALTLPAGASIISNAGTGSTATCSTSGSVYTCTFASIASGGPGGINMTVVFPQAALNFGSANSLSLTASATAQVGSGSPLTASTTTTVNQRSTTPSGEVIQATASPGSSFSYDTTAVVNFSLSPAPTTTVPISAFSATIDGGAPVTVSSTGTNAWQIQLGTLIGGSHTVSVNMAASSGYNAANASLTVVVTAAAPTLAYAGPYSATYGPSSTVQANVTGFSGSGVVAPTGTVMLSIDGAAATPATIVNGQAQFTVPSGTSAGSHALSFAYSGDTDYSAQTATGTYLINPAPLVAVADSASRVYGAANPTFTGVLTGVLSSDGITATYVSQANATTAAGNYATGPDAITPVLADPRARLGNYNVTVTPGTLTITPFANSITFTQIAAQTYGAAPLTLSATATSGQPVTFVLVSGPASLSGNTLTLTGAGTVTVSGKQDASGAYAAAVSSQSFVVAPAPLLIAVQNATRAANTENPAFTSTITGLVNEDLASSLLITYTTNASLGSPAGTYPVSATVSNAPNYSVTVTPGTLTVTTAAATITWSNPIAIVYGTPLSATQLNATSVPALTLTYSPPAGSVLYAGTQALVVSGVSSTVTTPVTATVEIVVQQASTSTILSAPATITSPYTITATVTSADGGAVTGPVNFFDGGALIGSGLLDNKGTATFVIPTLSAIVHSYTATYPGDANNLLSSSAAVSVGGTTPGDFTLVALPASLTLSSGTSGTVTLTANPLNGIRGPLSLTCTNLPANSTCTLAPASLTFDGTANSQTTTITIGLPPATTAANGNGRSILVCAALLPCLLLGSFGLHRNTRARVFLVLLLAAVIGAAASGCGAGNQFTGNSGTYAGNYNAIITATAGSVVHTTAIQVGLVQ